MLVNTQNGLVDTHPDYDDEVAQYGDDIIESAEEEYIESCHVIVETGTDGSWLNIEYADDYEKIIKENIEYFIEEYDIPKEMIEDVKEYVKFNIQSEENLQEIAMENYADRD